MQISELDPATLRRLSALRPERGKVLSIYLNLDPHEFATPPARRTAITSVLEEAERKARQDGLEHEERMALRADVERARQFFASDFTAKGAGALALFACGPAGLFEALRLPRPVPSDVVVDDSPWVEPLVRFGGPERVCVVLVNRRLARIFHGSRDRLEDVGAVEDDVHGWHDQGGWSQLRYQRGIEKEIQDHLVHASRRLFALWRRRPFDRLLFEEGARLPGVACPHCGWLGVDVARCPLDGTKVERREDVVEDAVEAVVLQSAEPIPLEPDSLSEQGRIAALLRF